MGYSDKGAPRPAEAQAISNTMLNPQMNAPPIAAVFTVRALLMSGIIGKYLSGLCKLPHLIIGKEGFEAQLRASRPAIPCGMRALGMTRQRRDGGFQGGIQPCLVPTLHGLDHVA